MSTNCLKTKLRGIVDNPDLLKVGEGRIKINNPNSAAKGFYINVSWPATIIFSQSIPYKLKGVDGQGTTIDVTTTGTNNMVWYVPANTEITASIQAKEDVSSYETGKYGVSYLNDDNNSMDFEFIGMGCIRPSECLFTGAATTVKGLSLEDIAFGGYLRSIGMTSGRTFGDIGSLSDNVSLERIIVSSNTKVFGTVESLGRCVSLQYLWIDRCPQIHGSLDALFNTWATAGKTGSLSLNFTDSGCTLSGYGAGSYTITFSGGSWSVS